MDGLISQEAIHALMHEALLPAPHGGFGQTRAAHDRHGPAPVGGGQDHLGSGDMLLRRIAIPCDRLPAGSVLSPRAWTAAPYAGILPARQPTRLKLTVGPGQGPG